MKIKKFEFPSFSDWEKDNNNVFVKLGDYFCNIDMHSFDIEKTIYVFVVSTSNVPTDVNSKVIFKSTYCYRKKNKIELVNWYNSSIEAFNDFWVDYIMATYFE